MITNLLDYLVKQLVSNPNSVSVKKIMRDETVLYEIIVDNRDRGRVIGKKGQTIKALRSLIQVIDPENAVVVELSSSS